MGRDDLVWDRKKHRRQSVASVRGSNAKRTGSVGANESRHSLDDQGCLGMVLMKVSDTWGIGSESWRVLASRNPLAMAAGLHTRRDVVMQWYEVKRKAAEGVSLRRRRKSPPVGCCRSGRRRSRSLRQQSHSTRVVVGVEILRHTSAHKGSPLFHRRAPALSTVHPEGSPDSSLLFDEGKLPEDPLRQTEALPINVNCAARFVDEPPSRCADTGRVACTPLQKGRHAGSARQGRRNCSCQYRSICLGR